MEVQETPITHRELWLQQQTHREVADILMSNLQKCSKSNNKEWEFSFLLKRIICSSQQYYSSGPQKPAIKCRHFLRVDMYCAHSDLNFRSPTKTEKNISGDSNFKHTFVKNTCKVSVPTEGLFLLSIFKPQVLVKALFKLDKRRSQTTSEMNKRKDLRLLWTHSFGTCSMQHHRNASLKAETLLMREIMFLTKIYLHLWQVLIHCMIHPKF